MKLKSAAFLTASEVCSNLCAGWFGAAFIIPSFSDTQLIFSFPVLIIDITFGIVFFVVSFKLKQLGGKNARSSRH